MTLKFGCKYNKKNPYSTSVTIRFASFCFFIIFMVFSASLHAKEFNVTSTNDAIDANPGDGVCKTLGNECTLRAAIIESNVFADKDVINLPSGTYVLSVGTTDEDESLGGDLDILSDITINGDETKKPVISGGGVFRVFSILMPADSERPNVKFNHIVITKGFENNDNISAIVNVAGYLYLDNVVVQNAGAGNRAIANFAYLKVTNSKIMNNDKGIYTNNKSVLIVEDSELSNNISTTQYSGTAITSIDSRINLTRVLISGNYNISAGPAVYASESTVTIVDSTFSNNSTMSGSSAATSAGSFGGALYFDDSKVTISKSVITKNITESAGGGIYSRRGSLTLDKTVISDNKVNVNTGGGGGLYYVGAEAEQINTSVLRIMNSVVTKNIASVGGGMYIESYDLAGNRSEINNTEISENVAFVGGGIYYKEQGSLTLQNTTVSGNTGNVKAGGLYVWKDTNITVDIMSATFANNTSPEGGNIFNDGSQLTLNNSILSHAPNASNCVGTVTSLGFNLDSDGSCALAEAKDLSNLDPVLDALATNEGFTRTHALLNTSPAIDSGDVGSCEQLETLDQRFFYRGDNACDIGSFEFGAALAQTGKITFSLKEASVLENTITYTFTVKRVDGNEGAVSAIVYPVTLSTAKLTEDFYFSPKRIYWPDGDAEDKSLVVTLVDNQKLDGDKTIVFTVGNSTGNVLIDENEAMTLTITDDESAASEIEFMKSEFIFDEGMENVVINVVRKGSRKGSITFTVDVGVLGAAEATILDGQTGMRLGVDISPFQNNIYDGDVVVDATILKVSDGTAIGKQSSTKIIIKDDEVKPNNPGIIQFSKRNYTVTEGDGVIIVKLLRTGGSEGNMNVGFYVDEGSAKSITDFGKINGQDIKVAFLPFEDGQNEFKLAIDIKNDDTFEFNESFKLSLKNIRGGASIGDADVAVINIVDDDTGNSLINDSPTNSTVSNPISSPKSSGAGSLHILNLILLFLFIGLSRGFIKRGIVSDQNLVIKN